MWELLVLEIEQSVYFARVGKHARENSLTVNWSGLFSKSLTPRLM